MAQNVPAREWQDISTAPLDGTRVDLYGIEKSAEVLRGLMMPGLPQRWTDCFYGTPRAERPVSKLMMPMEPGWYRSLDVDKYQRIYQPTHWMLVPPSPL